MKKKRTLTVVAAVLAVLMLGVGYAAVANDLLYITNASASATPSDANFVVQFDEQTPVVEGNNVTADYTDATNATFAVSGLTAKGQTASATYAIENLSPDLSANLTAEIGTMTNGATGTEDDKTYFSVSYSFADTTITAGGSTTLTVTVTMLKTPVAEDVSVTFPVTITASAVQPTTGGGGA